MRNANSSLSYPQPGIDKCASSEYALPVRFGSDLQCFATNLQGIIKTLHQLICKSCKSFCSKAPPSQDYKTQNARRSMHLYPYSNNDIQQRTALKLDFINHCNSKLGDLLAPFRIKGDKNKLLYDESGLRLWDVIKHHKNQGENIRQIRAALEHIVRPDSQTTEPTSKPTSQTFQTNPQDSQDTAGEGRASDQPLKKIERLYERMLEDKERQIAQAQERTDEVKQVLRMLLPPGKTPEQVKAERGEVERQLTNRGKQIEQLTSQQKKQEQRDAQERALIEEYHKPRWRRRSRKSIMTDIEHLRSMPIE